MAKSANVEEKVARPIKLPEMPRVRGESRKIVDKHSGHEDRVAVRMARVDTGGVDRETGEPLEVFYEVTAKVPGHEESTRVYVHERNAELIFLAAQHGVVNLGTPLYELPTKLWRAYRDEDAFEGLEDKVGAEFWLMGIQPLCRPTPIGLAPRHGMTEHMAKLGLDDDGTRISSGDSHAVSASGLRSRSRSCGQKRSPSLR